MKVLNGPYHSPALKVLLVDRRSEFCSEVTRTLAKLLHTMKTNIIEFRLCLHRFPCFDQVRNLFLFLFVLLEISLAQSHFVLVEYLFTVRLLLSSFKTSLFPADLDLFADIFRWTLIILPRYFAQQFQSIRPHPTNMQHSLRSLRTFISHIALRSFAEYLITAILCISFSAQRHDILQVYCGDSSFLNVGEDLLVHNSISDGAVGPGRVVMCFFQLFFYVF